jgi:hypothetical protein
MILQKSSLPSLHQQNLGGRVLLIVAMNEKITLTLIDEVAIQNRYSLIGLEADSAINSCSFSAVFDK